MGELYVWDKNPFRDIFMSLIYKDYDISAKEMKKELYDIISQILGFVIENPNDIVYLDFNIIKRGENYQVVANNILCALWLSGITPKNSTNVIKLNYYEVNNVRYEYNVKRKKLEIKKIK